MVSTTEHSSQKLLFYFRKETVVGKRMLIAEVVKLVKFILVANASHKIRKSEIIFIFEKNEKLSPINSNR